MGACVKLRLRKMENELIFVYNADSGIMNAVKDYFHKVISPKTYECSLCTLTYDILGMKSEWKKAIKETGIKTIFLHKDELAERYSLSFELPVVLLKKGDKIRVLISAEQMNKIRSLNELIEIVNKTIKKEFLR